MTPFVTISLLALAGITLFLTKHRRWGSLCFASLIVSILIMLLDWNVFLVVMHWVQELIDVAFVLVIAFYGWRLLLFLAEYIDDMHDALLEIRNTLNEIRDELKAVPKKGQREQE